MRGTSRDAAHTRDAIEAHLTIVFAALAVARYLQGATGMSVKKIVQALRALQQITHTIACQEHTAADPLTEPARDILTATATKWPTHLGGTTRVARRRSINHHQPLQRQVRRLQPPRQTPRPQRVRLRNIENQRDRIRWACTRQHRRASAALSEVPGQVDEPLFAEALDRGPTAPTWQAQSRPG